MNVSFPSLAFPGRVYPAVFTFLTMCVCIYIYQYFYMLCELLPFRTSSFHVCVKYLLIYFSMLLRSTQKHNLSSNTVCCREVLKNGPYPSGIIGVVWEKKGVFGPLYAFVYIMYFKVRISFFFPMQIFRCKRVWDYQLIRWCSFSLVKEHFKLCDMVVICILDSDFGSFHVWQ